jgi:hypothetical protein
VRVMRAVFLRVDNSCHHFNTLKRISNPVLALQGFLGWVLVIIRFCILNLKRHP